MARASIALVTFLVSSILAGNAQAQAMSVALASVAVNAQRWPRPHRQIQHIPRVRIPDPPECEIGVTWSSWLSTSGDVETLGVSYGRYLSKELALEAAVDIGRHEKAFTLSSVQLRAVPTNYGSPVSLVVGVAHATPGLPGWPQPRGFGLLVGGGMAFRVGPSFTFRMDLQLLRFRDDAAAGRGALTILVGLD